MAMISILGLYNYDSTIFEDLSVPRDDNNNPLFDKDTLIATICVQNAELSLVYSEPSTMKDMIRLWSIASQYSWKTLAKTMYLDYNPIWNKDGTVTEDSTASGENENKVAAYNSSVYEPREKGSASSGSHIVRVEQGNIGVTSSQQLIKEEREVAAFNVYDAISEDFRERFCLMVY